METSVVPEEENHASTTSGSIIQIKAISIDLKIPMQTCQTEDFQHNFSILGYAAEMRTKNPKASNPFQHDGNLNDYEEELPPLPVPKFRWWRCSECRRNMDIPSANEETALIANDISSSLNKISGGDADVLSEAPQGPPPVSNDQEKVPDACNGDAADAEIEPVEATRNKNSDGDDQAIPTVGDKDVTGNEKVTLEGTDGDNDDVPDPSEFQKAQSCGPSEYLPEEKMNTDDEEQRTGEAPISSGDLVQNTDEVAVAEAVGSVAPVEVEAMNNNTLSDSDQSQQRVPCVSRRKVRKVRLLSDLLGDKGSLISDPLSEGDFTSSSKLPATEPATSLSRDLSLYDDVGKDTNSAQSKGKMPLEEKGSADQDRVAGKSNDLMTRGGTELTIKGNEIPCSGPKANAPCGTCLVIGNKADRLKRKAERNQSLARKKYKPAQVNDALPPNKHSEELPKNANARIGDLKKSNVSNTSLFKSVASPAAGGQPNSYRDYWSTRETDQQKNNLTQKALQIASSITVNDWSSRMGLPAPDSSLQRNGSSGNQENGETSSVLLKKNDFRFREGGTPPASDQNSSKRKQALDLNERAPQSSSFVLSKGSFSGPKERDFFRAREQGKEVVSEGPSMLMNDQNEPGKAVAAGSSDVFPMDVVEYMAQNQYERAQGSSRSPLVSSRTLNIIRRFPEVQDIRNKERPGIGYPGLTSFSSPPTRSGMITPITNKGTEKGNSMDYSQIGRNHFNLGQVNERTRSIFSGFPQNQQIISGGRQFPATGLDRAVPKRSEVVEPSLLSGARVMPFGLGSIQKCSAQTPESCHKGKTISDIKADELKKTQEAHFMLSRSGGFELNQKLKGPLDPYANETIPAMQLLSLMDERSPGITFNRGTGPVPDNTPPPGFPLKSNLGRRTGFLNGSMFAQNNPAKESSGLGVGIHNAKESSGRRPLGFSGSLSLQPQGHDNLRENSQISGSATDVAYIGPSSRDKGKAILDHSDVVDGQTQQSGDHQQSGPVESRGPLDMETESGHESRLGLRDPPTEICVLNRNPAEFSLPVAGNEYTIHGRDIKFRKRKYSRSGNSSVRIDGPRQQRNSKSKAAKEKGQNSEA